MKKKFRISGKIKYLLMVLVCITIIGLSFVTDKGPAILRTAASYTVVPIQRGLSGVGGYISAKMGKFDSYKELSDENASLKAEIDNLTEINRQLSQNKEELKRLQSLYNLSQYYSEYSSVAATVIGKGDDTWFSTLVIDKGSVDGITENMNVITHGGLVGIVTDVGEHFSTVRCIIDDSSNVSAQDGTTQDNCIVKGDLTLINENRIYFDQMENNDNQVQVGDQIFTSPISSKFLPGILIGTIAEVKVSANNLTRYGYITPAVDFEDVREVLVVTDLKDTGSGE